MSENPSIPAGAAQQVLYNTAPIFAYVTVPVDLLLVPAEVVSNLLWSCENLS